MLVMPPLKEFDKDLWKKELSLLKHRREQKNRRTKIIDGEKEAYLIAGAQALLQAVRL